MPRGPLHSTPIVPPSPARVKRFLRAIFRSLPRPPAPPPSPYRLFPIQLSNPRPSTPRPEPAVGTAPDLPAASPPPASSPAARPSPHPIGPQEPISAVAPPPAGSLHREAVARTPRPAAVHLAELPPDCLAAEKSPAARPSPPPIVPHTPTSGPRPAGRRVPRPSAPRRPSSSRNIAPGEAADRSRYRAEVPDLQPIARLHCQGSLALARSSHRATKRPRSLRLWGQGNQSSLLLIQPPRISSAVTPNARLIFPRCALSSSCPLCVQNR